MTRTATEKMEFLGGTAEVERRLASAGPEWMTELRRDNLERFEADGLPRPSDEAWRSTSVAPLLEHTFDRSEAPVEPAEDTLPSIARLNLGGTRLVFVDGRYSKSLSSRVELPSGVWVGTLADAVARFPDAIRDQMALEAERSGPFGHLNGAFLDDGAVVVLENGVQLDDTVELIHLSGTAGKSASHPRTLVLAGDGSRADIVELFAGLGDATYFTNAVAHLSLGDNASISFTRIQLENETAFHIAGITSIQGRDSRLTTHVVDLGARLVRNDIRSVLNGEGGNCHLGGLYLTRGSQHVDNHTTLDHAKANCDSREIFKGILHDRSRSVFTGRIIVREDAQKTDAKQSNPNLLLSDHALAHTRPQLEIYADDVKCTHGATIGRMDEDAIFYLRSRGVDRAAARNMLIHAFAGEVLDTLPNESLRDELERLIVARLDGTDKP